MRRAYEKATPEKTICISYYLALHNKYTNYSTIAVTQPQHKLLPRPRQGGTTLDQMLILTDCTQDLTFTNRVFEPALTDCCNEVLRLKRHSRCN